jgi:predicted DNA-binding transcriptional regulator YafY
MNRIDRLVATVLLLQSRRLIRAQDIAAHFEISKRTVYRDLRALEEAGVPLAAEAGEGYSLVPGYHLPPVMFTHEEAGALFVGGELVERFTDASLRKHVQSALLKIRAVLPEEKQDYLERLQEATAIYTRPAHLQEGYRDDALATIQHALVQRNVLSMEYFSNHRESLTQRQVEPLGLLYYSEHWHLIAYCRLREDYRDFRTDRIKTLRRCEETFAPHQDFSLKRYLQNFNRLDHPQEVQVKFKPEVARYVRERSQFGFVEETVCTDGVLMTFLVPAIQVMVNWLLSFGAHVEIVSPPALHKLLAERAQQLAAHYAPHTNELIARPAVSPAQRNGRA